MQLQPLRWDTTALVLHGRSRLKVPTKTLEVAWYAETSLSLMLENNRKRRLTNFLFLLILDKKKVSNVTVGYIDPSYFFDNKTGDHYLIWKLDGNSLTPHIKCVIFIQALNSDGLSVTGKATAILENTSVRC